MKEWNKEELKEMTEEENRIMSITGSGSGNSSSSDSDSDSDSGAASNTIETGDNYVENNNTSLLQVGKPGVNSNSDAADADADNDDSNSNRHQSTRSIMREKKILDTYDLAEDVYAFLFVAPVGSGPFCFALYVITVKVIIYGILMGDINFLDVTGGSKSATAAKFFLIPVALSMQTDLMHSFFCMANITYCPSVLKISAYATKNKLLFSFGLRTMDGIFSLAVNFFLMLITTTTLNVFTNFAALYFLQDIDDVFYRLVELGFFGDKMEHLSTICKSITFPRRTGVDNERHYWGYFRITHLDSIMFVLVFLALLLLYAAFIIYIYLQFGGFYTV